MKFVIIFAALLSATFAANYDCSLVLCAAVACQPNEVSFTPPGQCCPRCRPGPPSADCAAVSCPKVACAAGQESYVPPGQCCPSCRGCPGCANTCNGQCGNGDFTVACLVDPCLMTTCEAGKTCQANYCDGCTACCV